MAKPKQQRNPLTVLQTLEALIRADRESGEEMSEEVFMAMIHALPLALRREQGRNINRLVAALEVSGLSGLDWLAALRRYRAIQAAGDRPWKAGVIVLPPQVEQAARDLDLTSQRIREFKPEDYLCHPILSEAQSVKQREASAAATAKRRAKTQADREVRRSQIKRAMLVLAALKRIDAWEICDADILGQLARDGVDGTRNTLKPDIDHVRSHLEKDRSIIRVTDPNT